jgi:hypothetical protein
MNSCTIKREYVPKCRQAGHVVGHQLNVAPASRGKVNIGNPEVFKTGRVFLHPRVQFQQRAFPNREYTAPGTSQTQ